MEIKTCKTEKNGERSFSKVFKKTRKFAGRVSVLLENYFKQNQFLMARISDVDTNVKDHVCSVTLEFLKREADRSQIMCHQKNKTSSAGENEIGPPIDGAIAKYTSLESFCRETDELV